MHDKKHLFLSCMDDKIITQTTTDHSAPPPTGH